MSAPTDDARYVIREVEALLGTDSSDSLARRLGYRPTTLARLLDRWGRPDLGNQFRLPVVGP